MHIKQNVKTNKLTLIILSVLTPILIFSYNSLSAKLPICYFDEEEWVGTSCFFPFFIHGDFDSKIWETHYLVNQPVVTRFAYGLWLYPKYLNERNSDSMLDFNKFLISHGFNYCNHIPEYQEYKNSLGENFVTLMLADAGFTNDLVKKYGSLIVKNIELILASRKLNVLLSAISVILLFLFISKYKDLLTSLTFIFFYAYNYYYLSNGLMAHSEALFLLFFNLAIIYLYKYLFIKRNNRNLIIFSVFTGLCFSTKLNGLMLYFIYLFQILFFDKKFSTNSVLGKLFRIFTPLLIPLIIFTTLTPYTYLSPLEGIQNMFSYRAQIASYQSELYPNVTLPNIGSRISFIANSFSQNHLFLTPQVPINNIYQAILKILFLSGITIEIVKAFKGRVFSKFMISIFITTLIITICYIQLGWVRYLAHLIVFFIYYQTIGLACLCTFVYKKLSSVIRNVSKLDS